MPMKSLSFLAVISLLAITLPLAIAYDPGHVQDFCVGVNTPADGVFVNGKFCKNPINATADDFFFTGLDKPRDPTNWLGSNVTFVLADNLPGLNTLGISFARADYAVNGTDPPHIHPRASEFVIVLEGTLLAGFVSSDENGNQFFGKKLKKGDVFVFPQGLIHFQYNVGKVPAAVYAGLNSQNPGMVTVANTVFGSTPTIDAELLAKSFQLDLKVVEDLLEKFKHLPSFTAI